MAAGDKKRVLMEGVATAADVGAVNRAGGTMTGDLTIENADPILVLSDTTNGGAARLLVSSHCFALQVANVKDAYSTRRHLSIYDSAGQADIANAIQLFDIVDGKNTAYKVLHTGNKPNGSYTGNGSAEARTVDTGGIGNAIIIRGGALGAILTANGGIAWDTSAGNTKTFSASEAKFISGVLTLATNSFYLNSSSITYYYQVL